MKKIAIIGAAGFVGLELVNQLQKNDDYDLYAVTRDNGSFLLQDKKIKLLNVADIDSETPFDVVINLAFPASGLPQLYPHLNKKIFDTIKKLCSPQTKIIQVSTIAVFGFGLDKAIKPDFIPERRDYPYVEAKLSMEHMVKKEFPNNDVAIVRLGNVWGAASGTWTGAIAEKLQFGQYISVEGIDGYANITDVMNVASYLKYLVEHIVPGVNIYHLAEFSNVKWSQIIDLMAKELNVKPVYSDVTPDYSQSIKAEIKGNLKLPSLGETYRNLFNQRHIGSYVRSMVRTIGMKRFEKIRSNDTLSLPKTANLSRDEATFLNIVSASQEFKTHVLNNWQPVINFEESWQLIRNWMVTAGYLK